MSLQAYAALAVTYFYVIIKPKIAGKVKLFPASVTIVVAGENITTAYTRQGGLLWGFYA